MKDEKRFLQDVGIADLPYPMKVLSRDRKEGQFTVAKISISARLMHDFEARWIDRFIQVLHQHEGHIGPDTLRANILDYLKELDATQVKVDFAYPFFMEKSTPVSKEKCLVCYTCTYSASVSKSDMKPKVSMKISVPCITTYPTSSHQRPTGLFAQLSVVEIEVDSQKDLFPEDLVDMVDQHALIPVYSFLTEEDQEYVIEKVHTDEKTSVVMLDELKRKLAGMRDVDGYSVTSSNYGMLHSYSTTINIAKSMWIPFS